MNEEPNEEGGALGEGLIGHLEEVRARLIKCAVAVIVGFFACYGVSGRIYSWLVRPLTSSLPKGGHLTVLHPMEGFMTELKVAFMAGLVAALPVIFYQLWKFVCPRLHVQSTRHVWSFVIAATVFFLIGSSFAYWIVFPPIFKVLFTYGGPLAVALPSMSAAFGITVRMLFTFGLIFELPIVAFFLARVGILSHKTLSRNRGYVLIAVVFLGAVLTPPDVFSQMMLAVPLYILYEVSVVVARVFGAKPEPEAEEEQDSASRDESEADPQQAGIHESPAE